MRNRKLYQLLTLLKDEAEQQAFADYLSSPLFNSSKTLLRFYTVWRERILQPSGESAENLSPEAFLAGSKLLPARMDKYCSQLSKKAIDFFALQEYLDSEQDRLEKSTESLERRRAPRREWDILRDRLQQHIETKGASSDKRLQQLQFKWKEAETRVQTRETQRIWKEDFRGLHESVDSYYNLQKLKLACASANIRLIYNQGEDPAKDFLESFEALNPAAGLDPLTRAYWLTFQMITNEDETLHFTALFAILKDEGHDFDREELSELFSYALNYCMRRGRREEVLFQEYSAALYRELLENEIILVDGRLPSQALKNIVVIHCAIGRFDWVKKFLEAYRDRLSNGTDPHLFTYNEGVLAFYQGDFKMAIQKLKQVISQLKDDVFYELDARINLLKAYFEYFDHLYIEEVDEMFKMCDSFRIFVDRNQKISEIHKFRYGNFIREFKRFLRLVDKEPLQLDKLQKLYHQVEGAKYMVNKSWFLNKLNVLLNPDPLI